MLKFEINGQKLTRVDTFAPATDSAAYLKAAFTFSSDWAGANKAAIFRDEVTGQSYTAPLNSSGVCTVPAEVLTRSAAVHYQTQGNHFHVSLRGDVGSVRITTNEVRVDLARSGYTEGQTPAATTPDAYSQFVANVAADAAAATAAAEAAAASEQNVANLYANALKKTVAGEIVALSDVSPVEHELDIWVHGKNLSGISEKTIDSGLAYAGGGFAFYGTPGKVYTVSANFEQLGQTTVIGISIARTDGTFVKENYATGATGRISLTFTYPDYSGGVTINVFSNLTANPVDGAKCKYTNIQIEEGAEATEYESRLDPTTVTLIHAGAEYTPAADGSVSGVKSVSPSMTLLTDTPGVTVEATYHRDLVKAIEALEAALNT